MANANREHDMNEKQRQQGGQGDRQQRQHEQGDPNRKQQQGGHSEQGGSGNFRNNPDRASEAGRKGGSH